MRLAEAEVDDYVARVVELLERFGVVLTKPGPGEPIEVLESDNGSLSFELIGSLPDGRTPAASTIEVREQLCTLGGGLFERDGYEYELIDRERDFRRAFHLHDADWFQHEFLVVVHEHCEQPLGHADCDHYEGSPMRDGFAGVMALIDAWTGEPGCTDLRCLG